MYALSNLIQPALKIAAVWLMIGFAAVPPTMAQENADAGRLIKEFEEGKDVRDRVAAVRGVAALLVRKQAATDERVQILGFLKQQTANEDAVIRLTAFTEILKIAAAEQDVELGKLAMQGANDENINVRRGLMKYFRTFYAGRFEAGKAYREQLLEKTG